MRLDLGRLVTIARQMTRVGAAGAIAVCVDVAIYIGLQRWFEFAALAAFIGHGCGIVAHFVVSSRFLLRREMAHISGFGSQVRALGKFVVAGGCGTVATTAVVFVSVDRFGLHPLMGKALAMGVSFLVVFTALKLLVLQDRPETAHLRRVEV